MSPLLFGDVFTVLLSIQGQPPWDAARHPANAAQHNETQMQIDGSSLCDDYKDVRCFFILVFFHLPSS